MYGSFILKCMLSENLRVNDSIKSFLEPLVGPLVYTPLEAKMLQKLSNDTIPYPFVIEKPYRSPEDKDGMCSLNVTASNALRFLVENLNHIAFKINPQHAQELLYLSKLLHTICKSDTIPLVKQWVLVNKKETPLYSPRSAAEHDADYTVGFFNTGAYIDYMYPETGKLHKFDEYRKFSKFSSESDQVWMSGLVIRPFLLLKPS